MHLHIFVINCVVTLNLPGRQRQLAFKPLGRVLQQVCYLVGTKLWFKMPSDRQKLAFSVRL